MARSRSRSNKKPRGKNGKGAKSRSPSKSSSRAKSSSSRAQHARKKKDKKKKEKKSRRRNSSSSRECSGGRSRSRRSRDQDAKKKKRSSTPPRKKRSGSRERRDKKKKSRSRAKRKSRSRSRRIAGGFGKDAVATAPAAVAVAVQASGAGVPDWLSDLMGGSSAPTQSAACEPLQIPGALASVISNDSPAIKSIMAQTGATVSIRGDTMHMGYSLAFFTGAPQAAANAKEMVRMQIGLTESSTIMKEIEMSAELLAEGHVDAVLATLQQRGTVVPITVQKIDHSNNLVKIILGPGPVANVSTAEALMRKKIDGFLTDGGRQLCGQWRKGNCSFGANCKFRHGLELSSRKAPAGPQAGSALEGPPLPPQPPFIEELPVAAPAPLRTSATSGML